MVFFCAKMVLNKDIISAVLYQRYTQILIVRHFAFYINEYYVIDILKYLRKASIAVNLVLHFLYLLLKRSPTLFMYTMSCLRRGLYKDVLTCTQSHCLNDNKIGLV